MPRRARDRERLVDHARPRARPCCSPRAPARPRARPPFAPRRARAATSARLEVARPPPRRRARPAARAPARASSWSSAAPTRTSALVRRADGDEHRRAASRALASSPDHARPARSARPSAHDVLRDVGGAAQGMLPLAHAHDRHGRLGGDPLDVAAQIDVEHRVADHGDASTGGGVEQCRQPVAVERGVAWAGKLGRRKAASPRSTAASGTSLALTRTRCGPPPATGSLSRGLRLAGFLTSINEGGEAAGAGGPGVLRPRRQGHSLHRRPAVLQSATSSSRWTRSASSRSASCCSPASSPAWCSRCSHRCSWQTVRRDDVHRPPGHRVDDPRARARARRVLMVAGRVGSGIAAQLGSMRVTEQIDALNTLGTDPIKKLVTPRVLAALIMMPVLTIINDFVGIVGGNVIATFVRRHSDGALLAHRVGADRVRRLHAALHPERFRAGTRQAVRVRRDHRDHRLLLRAQHEGRHRRRGQCDDAHRGDRRAC